MALTLAFPGSSPGYNGAPSQELLVIRENHDTGQRSLDLLRWGLSRISATIRPVAASRSSPRRKWWRRFRPAGATLGERDCSHLGRPPRQQRREPGPMLGAMEFGIADHGQRPGRE